MRGQQVALLQLSQALMPVWLSMLQCGLMLSGKDYMVMILSKERHCQMLHSKQHDVDLFTSQFGDLLCNELSYLWNSIVIRISRND
jgi:hypothetical protein